MTPLLSVLAAFAVGAVIIAWAGENPLDIYRTVIDEALFQKSGWRDTLMRATPLVLIGVGLGLGFKANVWNIGAEGQMIVGGLCSIAVIGYVNDLPGAVLIPLGLILGAIGGGLWGALAGWVHVRYGVNIVIATLLLVFIAEPLATWAVRDPLKDPGDVPPAEPCRGQRSTAGVRVDRRAHRRGPGARRCSCGGLARVVHPARFPRSERTAATKRR